MIHGYNTLTLLYIVWYGYPFCSSMSLETDCLSSAKVIEATENMVGPVSCSTYRLVLFV